MSSPGVTSISCPFAFEEVIPVSAEYDQTMAFPQDVFAKAWESGYARMRARRRRRLAHAEDADPRACACVRMRVGRC